jgi:hypothetical protein
MQHSIRIALCLAALLLAAASAFAHHSVAGQFDSTKRVTLTGVVTKIDWINPHIYIHLAVTEESGEVTSWRLASLPTAMLRKAGLTQDMIRGDGGPVTADAILARDGTANLAWVTKLSYPDGHYYQLAGE